MPRAATWARIVHAVGVRLASSSVEDSRVPGAGRDLGERHRQRTARGWHHVAERPELVVDVGEVGDHLQHAGAGGPRAAAMPTSSSASAVSVGVGSPRLVRWFSVRDVVKPSAPAATASAASAPIASISSARGRLAVGAALAHHVQAQRAVGHLGGEVDVVRAARRARRGTRGSSATSHARPSCSAAPGMSSTPSISSMSRSWSSGRTGAKPTPQLPMTTVVTPCHDDGSSGRPTWPGRRSGCGCRRSPGVTSGRRRRSPRVAASSTSADLHDSPSAMRDVGGARGAPVPSRTVPPLITRSKTLTRPPPR